MHKYSKKEYFNFLNNLCQENCHDNDCILKSFLARMQPDVRMLVQLKCLQSFAREQKKDLSREDLMKKWVDEGMAEEFSKVYKKFTENKKIAKIDASEIYRTMKKGVNSEY